MLRQEYRNNFIKVRRANEPNDKISLIDTRFLPLPAFNHRVSFVIYMAFLNLLVKKYFAFTEVFTKVSFCFDVGSRG